jgi:hypothetical protein
MLRELTGREIAAECLIVNAIPAFKRAAALSLIHRNPGPG